MSATLEINSIYNNLTYDDFAGTDVTISCLLIIILLNISSSITMELINFIYLIII